MDGHTRDRHRVYVGNLPDDIRMEELTHELGKFGRIRDVDIKFGRTRNGTAYAFAEFADAASAERAVREGDDSKMFGVRVKVEYTGQKKSRGPPGEYKPMPPPQRSENKVIITGLPKYASWQDLKDHMREAGPVGFATVHEDGVGVVEYRDKESSQRAVEMLNNSSLRTHLDQSAVIQVFLPEDYTGTIPARLRSPSPRRRDYSPRYSRRRSYSRSPRRFARSPSRDYSPSPRYSRRRSVSPRRRYSGEDDSKRRRRDADRSLSRSPSYGRRGRRSYSPRARDRSLSPEPRRGGGSPPASPPRSVTPERGRSATPPRRGSMSRSPCLSPTEAGVN